MATPAVEMKERSTQRKKWRRYPRYKDSGVEWLGEIPEEWDSAKISYYSMVLTGGTPNRSNPEFWDGGVIPWISSGEVNKRLIFDSNEKITRTALEKSNAKILPINSVMIALNGQGKTKGTAAILKIPAACNQSLAAIICNKEKLDFQYLFSYLNSRYRDIRGLVGNDIRDGLNLSLIRSLPVYLPPLPEQHTIATFLDRETARIDALIEKKERQIELLQEKRAALISHAVTKGLDSNAKMKDSGVEWLGEVPEQWEIKRLKYVSPRINEKTEEETDLPYIGLENIESWTGKFIPNEENYEAEGQSNKFQKGDVLFNKLRPYLAKVLVATESGRCTSELLVLRPKMVTQYYLFYFLLSKDFVNTVDSSTYGAKMPRANWNSIGDLLSPLPPAHEQEAIATFLNIETAKIDGLINKINNSIGKVNEYRAALISAAVTGKIDVRQEILA